MEIANDNKKYNYFITKIVAFVMTEDFDDANAVNIIKLFTKEILVALIYFRTLRKGSAILGLSFSAWCWLPSMRLTPVAGIPWVTSTTQKN